MLSLDAAFTRNTSSSVCHWKTMNIRKSPKAKTNQTKKKLASAVNCPPTNHLKFSSSVMHKKNTMRSPHPMFHTQVRNRRLFGRARRVRTPCWSTVTVNGTTKKILDSFKTTFIPKSQIFPGSRAARNPSFTHEYANRANSID